MTKSLVVAVLALAAIICVFPATSKADDITVTVGEQQYDITTGMGTFTDNMAELESQPWWGNATLAEAFANAVADDIGTPNDNGADGPLFVYDDDAVDGFLWFQGSSSSTSISPTATVWFGLCDDIKGGCAKVCSSISLKVTEAGIPPCATSGNVSEPASLSLLLAGLLAYFWALRKRTPRRNGPPTEA